MTKEGKLDAAGRFQNAVENSDAEYLNEFEEGRQAGLNDANPDQNGQAYTDGYESGKTTREAMAESGNRNKVFVQPHPLGGLQVIMFASDGTQNTARLGLQDATQLSVVLNMFLNVMLQQQFFEAAQAAQAVTESGIVIPGQR
jgi:hypothetical protein